MNKAVARQKIHDILNKADVRFKIDAKIRWRDLVEYGDRRQELIDHFKRRMFQELTFEMEKRFADTIVEDPEYPQTAHKTYRGEFIIMPFENFKELWDVIQDLLRE